MADGPDTLPRLYRLMTWASPAYPIGAFSYSHGLEAAVETGFVHDRASLVDWLGWIVERGSGLVDLGLLVAAWRAGAAGDERELAGVAEVAAAWRGAAELAVETQNQGAAFLTATLSAWPSERLRTLAPAIGARPSLPVAFGLAAACEGISLAGSATAYAQSFLANLVSAAVRLVPLGQTDGQRALAELLGGAERAIGTALARPLDRLGTAAPMPDLMSMFHETQYTRLFRS